MRKICKKEFVNATIVNEEFENAFEEESLLFSKDIICGATVITELKKLQESYQKDFLHNARNHYFESGKYLIEKVFKNSSNNLKYFNFLQCKKFFDENSCENIIKIAKLLPGSVNLSMLVNEWHLLQTEKPDLNHDIRNYHFWHIVFEIKDAFGQTKYPIVLKVVKMCLSVSHGSADIERGFSLSCRIISEDKTNMSERTLNAKLYVLDALKYYDYKINLVPINSELLIMAKNANRKYKEYLEEERKKKEQQQKQEDEKNLLEEKQEEMEKIEQNLKSIKDLESYLVKIQNTENAKIKFAQSCSRKQMKD